MSGRPKRLLPAVACLTAALVLAFPGYAFSRGAGQDARKKALEYEVTVALKLVQVYVTDRSGKAVQDLDKGDFVLYLDGRSLEITDFERHSLAAPLGQGSEALPAPPAATPAPLLSRKFIFLVDLARNDHIGIRRTREAALNFLDTEVRPEDEVAVLSYHAFSGIALHENLTADHARVREILDGLGGVRGGQLGGGVSLSSPAEGENAPMVRGIDSQVIGFDFDWEQIKRITYDFARAMQDLARSLRYVPGFKNIIYFSTGVSRRLLYDLEDSKVRNEYDTMIKELATANCPVFSVNAAGQRAFIGDEESRGDHSLQILAEGSGGRYFHDVAQDEKIAEDIQDMTANFYVLGFRVGETWDGKFHEIRVAVRRDGCKVSAQGGYFSPEPFNKLTKFEKQLRLIDVALAEKPRFETPLGLPLAAVPCPGSEGGDLLLFTEFAVGGMEDVLGEKAEMLALVFDESNDLVSNQKGEIRREDLAGPAYVPYAFAALGPGRYKCRLVFRNLDTGRSALAAADITIPEPPAALALFPPLLVVPDKPALYLSFSGGKEKNPDAEVAPLSMAFPQVTTRVAPVVSGLARGISRLTAVARFSVPDGPDAAPPAFSAFLVSASGEKTGLSLDVAEVVRGDRPKTGGGAETVGKKTAAAVMRIDTLVARVTLPDVPPGPYRFVLTAEDAATGTKVETSRPITILPDDPRPIFRWPRRPASSRAGGNSPIDRS